MSIYEPLRIIIDSREQTPWTFDRFPVETVSRKLDTGDYTIEGFEDVFVIERKSIDDLTRSLGVDRTRFLNEIKRSQDLAEFAVYVESPYSDIEAGNYYSRIPPKSVTATFTSWSRAYDVDWVCSDSAEDAEAKAYHQLCLWYGKYGQDFF